MDKDDSIIPDDLQTRIVEIGSLSTLPQVAWQLIGALRDEKTSAADLQGIIEKDAALAAKVLSLANSALFGLRNKITTIERAVVVIGFRELEFLSLGAGLADAFDLSKTPKGFDGQGLWLHSLAVSWTARELAEAAFHLDPGGVMLAGLLHDLGKLILASKFNEELTAILELSETGRPYYEAEEGLNLVHTEIGYLLAKAWSLPEICNVVIQNHHRPETKGPQQPAVCIAALADAIVKDLEIGLVQESREFDREKAAKSANLDDRRLNSVVKIAEERLPALQESWLRM